ncbi:PREDICTED: ubiquitin domain-containing protein 2 isoform X1 [Miniopterus natalensis]|uniref:ubiquitin domain-containing protein 2 isoform X1 n=1 Tax=Miniopterus natalensis TaxID=291302 RepID=UPI0007A6C297|nr:PREDICTED: ubiquitin domain-containing protein 2 isoform X1 [Miniopterus natalensis]
MLHRLVGDGELIQVVASHLRPDFHLVEGLAVVYAHHAAHHLGQDDRVPQAPVQPAPLPGTIQLHQLLVRRAKQLFEIHARVGELVEGLLLLLIHFCHLVGPPTLHLQAQLLKNHLQNIGALTECYDELGNRYQLPVYCLAPPINMIEEKSDVETLDIPEPPPNSGYECQLRLRLSTGKDLKLVVRSTDTVYHMKRRLHAAEGVEPSSQRWFFSGRPLTDKMKLEELKIPKDYVVQVIMSQPLQNPTPVEN